MSYHFTMNKKPWKLDPEKVLDRIYAAGHTKLTAAVGIGASPSMYWGMVRGQDPSGATLVSLAKVLGCQVEDFYVATEPKEEVGS